MARGDVEELLGDYRPPREQATAVVRGLPPAAYTSHEFYRLECERLFARQWVFAGFAQDLPEVGDLWPTEIGGEPIVLVRDEDAVVRAFHNVCRHRGHLLVDAPCRGNRRIVCPYHAWSYRLSGELLRTPNFAGAGQADAAGFDLAENGMMEVRCAAWHDWIFVNLNGDAPALTTHLAEIEARLQGLDWTSLRPVAKFELGEVRCNWKFLVENFVEPYHVPVVHTRTAAGQPLREHQMFVDSNCFGCVVNVADAANNDGPITHLNMSAQYLAVFPNFILGRYHPDQIGVHLNVPVAPDRTRQWRAIYSTGANKPDPAAADALIELWREVHTEDHRATERLQNGRASRGAADGGVLSPHWETTIAHFHDLVIDSLR